MRKMVSVVVTWLTGAGCVALVLASGGGAQAAPAHPVIVVVPRSQVISEMQHGLWCTRVRPGWFKCTPVAPQ